MQDLPWLRDPVPTPASAPEKAFGVVVVLNAQRRAALAQVDSAVWSRYHVKVLLVVGVGFFVDAYDIFAIALAAPMLSSIYNLSSTQLTGLRLAAPAGAVCGNLLFGWLADVVGRRRMYGVELIVIILGTFGQTLSGEAHAVNILGVLILWRFIMGMGIGGDAALSVVIPAEYAPTRLRGTLVSLILAAQAWGALGAALVSLILVSLFQRGKHEDAEWRLLLGLGCVPAAAALYARLTLPETPRFTMDVERNVVQAETDVDGFLTCGTSVVDRDVAVRRVAAPRMGRHDLRKVLRHRRVRIALGALCWCAFSFGIASHVWAMTAAPVLAAFSAGSDTHHTAIAHTAVSLTALFPGSYLTALLIDRLPRRTLQLSSFLLFAVLFLVLGLSYNRLVGTQHGARGYAALWCLAGLAGAPARVTTALLPAELAPTRYRGSAAGLVGACGRIGVVVAQAGFSSIIPGSFTSHLLEILAVVLVFGAGATLLVPETLGRSLEVLSREDQEEFIEGMARYRMRPLRFDPE